MISDSDVKKNVEHELEWDAVLDATDVAVAVNGGVVTLTGFVRHYNEKLQAERAAKRVKGVYGLANEIEVRLAGEERSDPEIARDAVAALQMQLPVSAENIKAIVQHGKIRLEGQVRWHYQRQRAESAVRHLQGVKAVQNLISIAPAEAAKDVRGAIQAAFHRNAQLEADRVTIEAIGGEVVLAGKVNTWAEREEAERAAWMAPGVSSVRNNIGIGP
jgi:osmotically-inducible protein OsmY